MLEQLSLGQNYKNCEERDGKLGKGALNNSTLSLHIIAYENAIEPPSHDLLQDEQIITTPVNQKVREDPFSLPREQKDEEGQKEVTEFHSSDRVMNDRLPGHMPCFYQKEKETFFEWHSRVWSYLQDLSPNRNIKRVNKDSQHQPIMNFADLTQIAAKFPFPLCDISPLDSRPYIMMMNRISSDFDPNFDLPASQQQSDLPASQQQSVNRPGTYATNMMATLSLSESRGINAEDFNDKLNSWCDDFDTMSDRQQQHIVEKLLNRMSHHQIGAVDSYIKPLLQRDFIVLLPRRLAESVLENLDAKTLAMASAVSKQWRFVVAHGMLWRKLIEKHVREDSLWRGLSEKRGWKRFLFISTEQATISIAMARGMTKQEAEAFRQTLPDQLEYQHDFYRDLYPQIRLDINQIEENWKNGKFRLQRINCQSENSKGVYCLQYDDNKIISGLRDNTIKIWNRNTLQCRQTLIGHTGSVLCLQYDDKIIASGSSDATVRIWDVETGEQLNTLIHHSEAVLHLRFHNGMLVTCSKDRSIAVWTMHSSHEIDLRRVLVGHRAAVNVVDFDDTYIVSASGDRTIKVWRTDTCEFIRTLNGHKRGIACLQYRDGLIVSGSSDNTIRLWDIECGACLRVLEGHEELVRCIRFDGKRIVSGAYDGKIKVWDLKIAMDPRASSSTICIKTLVQHSGRVFRLQFDEFQIVSSSHDDTILIWDFLNTGVDVNNLLQQNGAAAIVGEVDQAAQQQQQHMPAAIGMGGGDNAGIQQHHQFIQPNNLLPAAAGGGIDNDDDNAMNDDNNIEMVDINDILNNGGNDEDMEDDIPLHHGNPIAAVLGFEHHPPLNAGNEDAAAVAIEQNMNDADINEEQQQQPHAE